MNWTIVLGDQTWQYETLLEAMEVAYYLTSLKLTFSLFRT